MISSRHIAPVNYWGLTKQVGPWRTTAVDRSHEALGYDSPHNQVQEVRPYQQDGSKAPTYEQVEIVSVNNINGLRGPGLRRGKLERDFFGRDARIAQLNTRIAKTASTQTVGGDVGGDVGGGGGGGPGRRVSNDSDTTQANIIERLKLAQTPVVAPGAVGRAPSTTTNNITNNFFKITSATPNPIGAPPTATPDQTTMPADPDFGNLMDVDDVVEVRPPVDTPPLITQEQVGHAEQNFARVSGELGDAQRTITAQGGNIRTLEGRVTEARAMTTLRENQLRLENQRSEIASNNAIVARNETRTVQARLEEAQRQTSAAIDDRNARAQQITVLNTRLENLKEEFDEKVSELRDLTSTTEEERRERDDISGVKNITIAALTTEAKALRERIGVVENTLRFVRVELADAKSALAEATRVVIELSESDSDASFQTAGNSNSSSSSNGSNSGNDGNGSGSQSSSSSGAGDTSIVTADPDGTFVPQARPQGEGRVMQQTLRRSTRNAPRQRNPGIASTAESNAVINSLTRTVPVSSTRRRGAASSGSDTDTGRKPAQKRRSG